MRVGTKSLLFGAHCFFVHPFFVAAGWARIYGFPWDMRLWAAFFFHDLGYVGCPNVEGPEGEEHVRLGARIMGLLFGDSWADFTLRHSRHWAKKHGATVSRLCYADKMAFVLTPAWLYLPMARATGELAEYMAKSRERQAGSGAFSDAECAQLETDDPATWLRGLQGYTLRWIERHWNGAADTCTVSPTPCMRSSRHDS
ncbi:MAG: HD domain-containing protein [Bryobacterales bacterium]|nr:HD domain-containing protein [Bryobacterales bacterium]